MSRFAENIRPYVDAELRAARADAEHEFAHLERAHVLGQASTREHVRVHWRMLLLGLAASRCARVRSARCFASSARPRRRSSAWCPAGNTGGANVSPVRPMPLDPELGRHHRKARGASASYQLLRSSRSFTNTVRASGFSPISGNFSRSRAMISGFCNRRNAFTRFSSPSVVTRAFAGS